MVATDFDHRRDLRTRGENRSQQHWPFAADSPPKQGGPSIETIIGVSLALLLIAVNGVYAGAQFALIAVNRYRIEQLAETGDRRAGSAAAGLRDLAYELSGAQLGITVSSLLLGFVAELLFAPALEDSLSRAGIGPGSGATFAAASLAVLVLLSFIQMVMGELVPKNFALSRPVQMTLLLAPLLGLSNRLSRPLVWLLNYLANLCIRVFGMEPADDLAGVRNSADLLRAIRWSSRAGSLPSSTSRFAEAVVAFDSLLVRDVFTPRSNVISLLDDATMADLARVVSQHGVARVPVLMRGSEEVLGVVSARALLAIARHDLASFPVRLYMQPILATPPTAPLYSVLLRMRQQQNPMAVALDEHGVMAGILTIEDALLPLLTGRADSTAGLTRRTVRLDGLATASECRQAVGFELPPGPYETLAGFLLMEFQRIPAAGDALDYRGWRFEILATNGMQVTRVAVTPPVSA